MLWVRGFFYKAYSISLQKPCRQTFNKLSSKISLAFISLPRLLPDIHTPCCNPCCISCVTHHHWFQISDFLVAESRFFGSGVQSEKMQSDRQCLLGIRQSDTLSADTTSSTDQIFFCNDKAASTINFHDRHARAKHTLIMNASKCLLSLRTQCPLSDKVADSIFLVLLREFVSEDHL